jgi:hypothetical protein
MANDSIFIENEPPKTELSERQIKQTLKNENNTWKTKAITPEELSSKLKKKKTKRKMTPKQLENLRQFSSKPHSEEAKINSLNNLRAVVIGSDDPNEDTEIEELEENQESQVEKANEEFVEFPENVDAETLREVLGYREQKFFVDRWNHYIEEMGEDFNTAGDFDDLKELILLYIQQNRLEKKKKNTPSYNYNDKFNLVCHNVHTRIQNLKQALKTRRKDRLETNDKKQGSFMNLIIEMAKNNEKIQKSIENKVVEEIETRSFLEKKRNRETGRIDDK